MSGHILANLCDAIVWIGMAFALWKGAVGARLAAVCVLLLDLGIDAIRLSFAQSIFETIELSMDLACAGALLLLAVRYANLWIGAAMIFQAAQFTLHSYYIVMDLPHDRIHAWVYNVDELGLVVSIVVGAILDMRRRKNVAREAAELEALRQQRAPVPALVAAPRRIGPKPAALENRACP